MAETDSKQQDDVPPALEIVATDSTDKIIAKESDDTKEESCFEKLLISEAVTEWEKSGRCLANIIVNFINFAITNTCLIYALASTHNNSVRLHIVFCVLGFQLCMNQGTLLFSKYNTWTIYVSDQTKRKIQWYLQAIGCVLISGGSITIVFYEHGNGYTSHSICGLCALTAYLLGFLIDRLVITLYIKFPDFKPKAYIFLVKFIHYSTSIAATLFYCMCLCYGFQTDEFQYWADEEEIKILKVAAYLLTAFVIIELFNSSVGDITETFEVDYEEEPYEDDERDVYVT